jgi:hypothetical protein
MIKMLNLTQHPATPAQKEDGVVDLEGEELEYLRKCITFNTLPSLEQLEKNSIDLAKIAREKGYENVLIGGACYFMPVLDNTLKRFGIKPYYAYSKRNAVDKMVDGKIITEYTFEHEGFLKV